jgi:hypothetical protein
VVRICHIVNRSGYGLAIGSGVICYT